MEQEKILKECAIRGIPADIVNWKIGKGMRGSQVWRCPEHVLEYGGKYWTPAMLEEHCGIGCATLTDRWRRGLRGDDLVSPVKDQTKRYLVAKLTGEALIKYRAMQDCAAHLEALRAAHPDHCEPPAFDTAFRENFARKFTYALEARARQVFRHAYV